MPLPLPPRLIPVVAETEAAAAAVVAEEAAATTLVEVVAMPRQLTTSQTLLTLPVRPLGKKSS